MPSQHVKTLNFVSNKFSRRRHSSGSESEELSLLVSSVGSLKNDQKGTGINMFTCRSSAAGFKMVLSETLVLVLVLLLVLVLVEL